MSDASEMTSPLEMSPAQMRELVEKRENIIKEQWIKVYEARLVRQELNKCYYSEGVNHEQACAPLVQHYIKLLKESKLEGWRKLATTA